MQINLPLTVSKRELPLDVNFFRETTRQNITEVGPQNRWSLEISTRAILGMLKNTQKYEYLCNN